MQTVFFRLSCCVLLLALKAAAITSALHAAEGAFSLKVVTDRENAIYRVGEEATFLISVTQENDQAADGTIRFVVDDFRTGGTAAGLPQGIVTRGRSQQELL